MRIHDAIVGLVIVVFGGLVVWHVQSFPIMPGQAIGPATFPTALGIGFMLCGAIIAFKGFKPMVQRRALVLAPGWFVPRHVAAGAVMVLGTLACAMGFETLGFPISVAALTFALLLLMRYRPVTSAIISVVFVAAIYWIMARELLVPLPLGPLDSLLS